MRPLRAALGLMLLTAGAAHAQLDYGRALTVTPSATRLGLGDSLTLRFRLTVNDRDLIADSVPQVVGEVPPGVRILSVERLSRGADRAFTGTAVVALYRPGKRTLPVFGIPWIQVVTGRRSVVTNDPVEVEVASVLPAGNPPLRDIREPDAPPSLWPLWALVGAALAAAAAWLVSRRRMTVPPAAEPVPAPVAPPPPPDPYLAALAGLDAIERERWASRGEVARHYQAVADTLRDYLESAEELPARERTTTELLWSLPPRLAEGGLRRRMQEVLGEADLVKFARRRPAPAVAGAYVGLARDLLERWHHVAAAKEELDAVR